MSTSTTTSTTLPPFSSPFYPYGYNNEQDTATVLAAINTTDRNLSNEINLTNKELSKDITQHTLGLRDAVERGNVGNAATMERINTQLATAVERNGLNIYGAVERVAGENRITTLQTDAATRQASNDLARDVTTAVERNGSANSLATTTAYGGLLQSVERNSGETRQAMGAYDSNMQGRIADTRRDITASISSGFASLGNEVSNAAWESRTGIVTGFSNVALEQAKNFSGLQLEQQKSLLESTKMTGHFMGKVDSQYASLQLEQQKALLEQTKTTGHLMGKVDTQYAATILESQKVKSELENLASSHYSSLLLEQQRVKEYLSSKGDNQFAMNQLELQKVKSELASQAANHFSVNQLEQAKLAAQISAQMADAKYEALKTQSVLAEKMGECCCDIKQKIDLIDRDRLRDTLSNQTNDNNLLKQAEFAAASGFGPGYGFGGPGYGPGYCGWGGARNQNGPGNGNGDVNVFYSDRDYYRGDRRRGRDDHCDRDDDHHRG